MGQGREGWGGKRGGGEERGRRVGGKEKSKKGQKCWGEVRRNAKRLILIIHRSFFINNLPSPSTFRYLNNYVVKCFNTNHRWPNVILSVSILDSCKLIRE